MDDDDSVKEVDYVEQGIPITRSLLRVCEPEYRASLRQTVKNLVQTIASLSRCSPIETEESLRIIKFVLCVPSCYGRPPMSLPRSLQVPLQDGPCQESSPRLQVVALEVCGGFSLRIHDASLQFDC